MKQTQQKERISRAFKSDFPEFVERAHALDVKISLSNTKGRRCFWLDGYRQLTGFAIKKDGSLFTERDAEDNIDKALTDIENDRRAIQGMNLDERFSRVMSEFRKIKPQHRMMGEVRLPAGDGGFCFWNSYYDGDVRLLGAGIVACARVEWNPAVGPEKQMALFCDLLEKDYGARNLMAESVAG